MSEKVLEFNCCVLPEDHPHIGEGRVTSVGMRVFPLFVRTCSHIFYLTCRCGYEQPCFDIF